MTGERVRKIIHVCESAWKIDPHLGDIGVEK